MKIINLKDLQAHTDWFGVKSKVEVEILDPLPRDSADCPGGGMAMLYFTMEPGEAMAWVRPKWLFTLISPQQLSVTEK